MTDEKNMTAHAIPWDLRRLPNFNYMEFTHVQDTGNGKQDLFMSLEGQKTWFRLACPEGGLVLNALRVTDAMAIFEARVFADANDRNPLASFTATKKADKATGDAYIRAAQDAALAEALKSAGFCLQISTLAHAARDAQPAQADDAGQPSEPPKEDVKPSPAPVRADVPKQKAGDASQPPVGKVDPPPKVDSAPRPAPVGPQPHAAPENKAAAQVVDINTHRPAVVEEKPAGQSVQGTQTVTQAATVAESASETAPTSEPVTYTADMTVEEITQRMTLEQAKAIKVQDGTCKGWTLEQVAKDRPPSLKWLRHAAPFADNVLKAAADIVLNDLELKVAG